MTQFSHVGEHSPIDYSSFESPRVRHRTEDVDHAVSDEVTRGEAWCLYLSHFLSMWNSRMYEFGAILFIQAAFPGNLTASSINGIAETICVLLFSSALGRWVDRHPSRIYVLLLTIITNRIAVTACCFTWLLIDLLPNPTYQHTLFGIVLVLGMVEKNSRMTNILSMERDWVPTLASSVPGSPFDLTHLNTVMKRIDMLCKFLAPLAISTFTSAVVSIKMAVLAVVIISLLSLGPECWCLQRVWKENRQLRAPKKIVRENSGECMDANSQGQPGLNTSLKGSRSQRRPLLLRQFLRIISEINGSIQSHVDGLQYYFRSPVWLPSLCVATLHASVLTWSGTFITYLLNAGFSLGLVTVAKAVGSIFEIGSTFIFPWAVATLSGPSFANSACRLKELHETEDQDRLLENDTNGESDDIGSDASDQQKPTTNEGDVGVVRVGKWGICGLSICLVPVVFFLFQLNASTASQDPSSIPSSFSTHPLPTFLLIAFLSFSLLGRWTYDLSATQLTQTLIPSSHRSSFGGTEMAIVSCVSLSHWVAAAIWHAQADFKWLALGSFLAVGMATVAYGWWARRWERLLSAMADFSKGHVTREE